MCTTISDFCTCCLYRYSGGGDWVESECVLQHLISVHVVFADTLVVETGWRSECVLLYLIYVLVVFTDTLVVETGWSLSVYYYI